MSNVDWVKAFKPLLEQYKNHKHPLDYKSLYELVVMVILSAQDSDRNINALSKEFFKLFPDLKSLSNASEDLLATHLSKVRNFGNKINWLLQLSRQLKMDKNIPLDMEGLVALPGIGRKSANVIRREMKQLPEGVIVDLHVVRVAPRIGVSFGSTPVKIEKDIMNAVPQEMWDVGMAISFLGREICRPTNPKCEVCVMNKVCDYYKSK